MKLRIFKKYMFSTVLLSFLSITVYAAQELDSAVAVVNDNVITQSQLNAMVFDMRNVMQNSGVQVPSNVQLKKQALEQLISESLQLQVAARNDIKATDADIDNTINNIASRNGITVEQLRQTLAQEGISYNKFRTQIHDQIVVRELQRGLFAGKIKVTDQEAKNYIKAHPLPKNPNIRYHLNDLLVPVAESAPQADIDAAKEKALTVLNQAKAGESLEALAISDEAFEFNDLDWRTVSQLPSAFSQAVLTMNEKDVVGPIKAPNGYHILKLLNKQGQNAQLSMEQAKNIIYQQKLEKNVKAWVEQIKKSAYVKILN